MLRFLDAGETHGQCLTAILEGLPSGLPVDVEAINQMLALRQGGYGRGGRMKIEADRVQILSGVRTGHTLGSPVALMIENKDYDNWREIMGPDSTSMDRAVYVPRPGHADLTGALKYDHTDMRNVLERASARETAIRTAVGALCKQLLQQLDIELYSRVVSIGPVQDCTSICWPDAAARIAASDMRMYDAKAEQQAISHIEGAKESGESVGGVVEVVALNVPAGLGSYVQYDRKLDGRLGGALLSVQAIKGVEFGMGFACAAHPGSEVHDPIAYHNGFVRLSNHAGGIEGGMSNGQPIVVRAAMKPIPTLYQPLGSIDIRDKKSVPASVERSDICAVPACSIVCEAVVAFELAACIIEKFSADSIGDLQASLRLYLDKVKQR